MAIWYVDPSISIGAESDSYVGQYGTGKLRSLWSRVTWTTSDWYFQRCDTESAEVVNIAASGVAGAPIRIGSYGTGGRPRINGAVIGSAIGCIYCSGRSYITIDGLELFGAAASYSAGVLVYNSSNVVVQNCVARNSFFGIRVASLIDAAAADVLVQNNECYGNDYLGIVVEHSLATGIKSYRINVIQNRVHHNGNGSTTSAPRGGIQVWPHYTGALDATRGLYDCNVLANEVYDNRGYGLAVSEVYMGAARPAVRWNHVYRNGLSGDLDTHSLWVGACYDMDIEFNHVHDNGGYYNQSAGSGVGIFLDQRANGERGQRCVVRGNVVHDQYRGLTQAAYPSGALYSFHQLNAVIEGNIAYNCRNGVCVIGDSVVGNNTVGTLVRGNALVNMDDVGIVVASYSDTTAVSNNIVMGAQVGLFVQTTGGGIPTGTTESNNDLASATVYAVGNGSWAARVSGSLGSGDITTDPLFADISKPWLGLKPGSPCKSAGAYIQGARDRFGRRYLTPSNIGPWAVLPRA